jgi:hypothetical protein
MVEDPRRSGEARARRERVLAEMEAAMEKLPACSVALVVLEEGFLSRRAQVPMRIRRNRGTTALLPPLDTRERQCGQILALTWISSRQARHTFRSGCLSNIAALPATFGRFDRPDGDL